PTSAYANQPLRYVSHVSNAGPSPAQNIAVSITLPGNATLVSVGGSGWTCAAPSGGAVSCAQTTPLTAGQTGPDLTLVLTPPANGGTVQVTETASSDSSDANPADNQATVTTAVTTEAD